MISLESIFSVVMVFIIWYIYIERTMLGPHRYEQQQNLKRCVEYEEYLKDREKLINEGRPHLPAGPTPPGWHTYLKKKYG